VIIELAFLGVAALIIVAACIAANNDKDDEG
jgi:hypothetical protein